MYMNYFIEQEYGEDYYKRADEVVDLSKKHRTIDKMITDCFEQIVYSINQPTGARNFQAVFWNVAYYDRYYFESLFGEFVFPDGTKPHWKSLSWLQKRFMTWFNRERTKTVLTFPVETMALLTRDGDVMDKEWGDITAQMYPRGTRSSPISATTPTRCRRAAACATRYRTTGSVTRSAPAAYRPVRRAC